MARKINEERFNEIKLTAALSETETDCGYCYETLYNEDGAVVAIASYSQFDLNSFIEI